MSIKSTTVFTTLSNSNYFTIDGKPFVFELSLRCQHADWNGHRVIGHVSKDYALVRLINDIHHKYCRELNSGWFVSIDIVHYCDDYHKFGYDFTGLL